MLRKTQNISIMVDETILFTCNTFFVIMLIGKLSESDKVLLGWCTIALMLVSITKNITIFFIYFVLMICRACIAFRAKKRRARVLTEKNKIEQESLANVKLLPMIKKSDDIVVFEATKSGQNSYYND